MPKPKLFFILPALNEEENLPKQFANIKEICAAKGCEYTIVVINDGSTDRTAEVTLEAAKTEPVLLVNHPRNLGVAAAFRNGFKKVSELAHDDDIIITMDADNTQQLRTVGMMVNKIEEGYEMAVGSCFATGGMMIGVPLFRYICTIVCNFMYRLFFPVKGIREYTGFFRAYSAGAIKKAVSLYGDNLLQASGFVCMAELLVKLRKIPIFMTEVPMIVRYDLKGGASKMKIIPTTLEHLWLMCKNFFDRRIFQPAEADNTPGDKTYLTLFVICLLVFAIKLWFVLPADGANMDEIEYIEVAQNLKDGRGFVTDYQDHICIRGQISATCPAFERPPLSSILTVPFLYLTSNGLLAARLPGILLSSFVLPFAVLLLAWKLSREKFIAFVSAVFSLVFYYAFTQSMVAKMDAASAVFAILAVYHFISGRDNFKSFYWMGLWLGLGYLTSENVAVFALLMPVAYLIYYGFSGGKRLRSFCGGMFFALLVISPWLIRNQIVFGHPFFSLNMLTPQAAFTPFVDLNTHSMPDYFSHHFYRLYDHLLLSFYAIYIGIPSHDLLGPHCRGGTIWGEIYHYMVISYDKSYTIGKIMWLYQPLGVIFMGIPSLLAAFFKQYRRYVILFYLFILGVICFHSLTVAVAARYYLIFWPLMIILSVIFYASLFQKLIPDMKTRQLAMIIFAFLLGIQMFSCDLIRVVEGSDGPERQFKNNKLFTCYDWAKRNLPKSELILADDFKRWHYHLGNPTISANQKSFRLKKLLPDGSESRDWDKRRNSQNLLDVLAQFRPKYAENLPLDETRMLVEPKINGWIIHANQLDMPNYLKNQGFDKFPVSQRRLLTNGTVEIDILWSKIPIPQDRPINSKDLENSQIIYSLKYHEPSN